MSSGVQKVNGRVEIAGLAGVSFWWENSVLQAGRLQPGASIEEWIETAGMGFTFRKAKLMFATDRSGRNLAEVEGKVAIVRADTGAMMGIASADYNITQPYEMLEFYRDLVAGSGFELTTAGVLYGGKRMWALARITEAKINGWDKIGAYLLLSSSSDGSLANEGRLTTVCVVCDNTLRMAIGRSNAKAAVSHRVSMAMAKLKSALGLDTAREQFDGFIETASALSKAKVSAAAAEEFVIQLLSGASAREETQAAVATAQAIQGDTLADLLAAPFVPKAPEVDLEALLKRPRGVDPILALFEGGGRGSEEKGRDGTAWGLVNAVTEYVDHVKPARSDDNRIASAWWGDGERLKADAAAMALERFT